MASNGVNMRNYFEDIGAWPRGNHSLIGAYVAGFALSLALTFLAYEITLYHVLSRGPLLLLLALLALAQFAVQVICFLHLGSWRASRERLVVFLWASMIVLILVAGSLWIMFTLQGRMAPEQMQQYMQSEGGF